MLEQVNTEKSNEYRMHRNLWALEAEATNN